MNRFPIQLRRVRVACFAAQFFLGLSVSVAALLVAALLAALADWGLALSAEARESLRLLIVCLAVVGMMASFASACRTVSHLPVELDKLNRDSRCTIACALGLPESGESPDSLGRWLLGKARFQASEAVQRARRHAPAWRRWAWGMVWLLISGAAVGGMWSAFPRPVLVLGQRLWFPSRDIPPLSPYVFRWQPYAPTVHYGEDLALRVHVAGGEPPKGINLLLQFEGGLMQTLPAFRNREGDWSRVLEKVTSPCSVAFATADGRARSRFIPVKVNHSPRILGGMATVIPLPYTGLGPKQVRLGGSEILVPEGGSVVFELNCSREIAGGYALFVPAGSGQPQKVEARAEGKSLHLSMKVREAGTLSMQALDADGRASDVPVCTRLAVLPDAPPEVVVSQPEDGAYLVVGHPLEVQVEASDDYGVERLSLFKALAPYRQHGISILQGKQAKQVYRCKYDTAAMGLKPGDVLEWRAEVGDANPFRFHIASSPTVSVTLVSEEEYAAILRLGMDYDEFLERYRMLEEALGRQRQALEAVIAAESAEERALALKKAVQEMQQAKQLAQGIAEDFPVFDMDKQLSGLAKEMVQSLESAIGQLSSPPPGAEDVASLVRGILDRQKTEGEALGRQAAEAAWVDVVARAMEAQMEFAGLFQRQQEMEQLFRRFKEEFGAASTTEPDKLEGLGRDQASLRNDYSLWEESLSPLLADLSRRGEEGEPLRRQLFLMREACGQAGVEGLMDEAAAEAAGHHPADAHAYARRAREGMQQLISQSCSEESCNNAAQQCLGSMSDAARATLQQMLDAMKNRKGQGGSYGVGGNGGASPIPGGGRLMGPSRSHWRRHKAGKGNAVGPGTDFSQRRGHSPQRSGKEEAKPAADAVPFPEGTLEQVPPVYRDAVRQYFLP